MRGEGTLQVPIWTDDSVTERDFSLAIGSPIEVDEHTPARRADARLGRPGGSRSLRAVMDVYLPDFGINNL